MDILIEHPPNQKAATETKNVAYFNKTLNYNTEWRTMGMTNTSSTLSTPPPTTTGFVAMDGPSSGPALNDFY